MDLPEDQPPKKHYRGSWLRPEIMEMVETKLLSAREALLLMLIDSLVEHGGDDCFASNKWFANKLDWSPWSVSVSLSKLMKLGMILQTKFDGRRRHLATVWSRIQRQTIGKSKGRLLGNPKAPVLLRNTPNTTSLELSGEPDRVSVKSITKVPYKDFATQFADAISSARKVSLKSDVSRWWISFRLLHKKDGITLDRIEKVLNWYCRVWRKEGDINVDNPNWHPVTMAADGFRKKFDQLEGACHRHLKKMGVRAPRPKLKVTPLEDTDALRDDPNYYGDDD